MTATPRLGLEKPAIGTLGWGVPVNDGFDLADERLLKVSTDFLLGATQIETPTFVGGALNDLVASGTYTGVRDKVFKVRVVDAGVNPDTYEWSQDGGVTWTGPLNMSVVPFVLADGLAIAWGAVNLHQNGDLWTIVCKSTERENPNDINGNGTPLTVDYIGQRYLYARDAIWWVATAISAWEREGNLFVGTLADRPPKPPLDTLYVDSATGIIYSFDVTTDQWQEGIPDLIPGGSALKVHRVNAGGTALEFGPKLTSPVAADAFKMARVNSAGDGYDFATSGLREAFHEATADISMVAGPTEVVIPGYLDLPIPGPLPNGTRRIHLKLHVSAQTGGAAVTFTVRIHAGTTGGIADPIVYTNTFSASSTPGFLYADIFLKIPANATKLTVGAFSDAFGAGFVRNSFDITAKDSDYLLMREIGNA